MYKYLEKWFIVHGFARGKRMEEESKGKLSIIFSQDLDISWTFPINVYSLILV